MDWELTRSFFIALLAISNPISKIALWVQGSDDEDHQVRWRLALMLTGTAFIVLVVFLIGGQWFLDLFGVDLASFRVGGGVVIGLVGLDMIRGQATRSTRTPRRSTTTTSAARPGRASAGWSCRSPCR